MSQAAVAPAAASATPAAAPAAAPIAPASTSAAMAPSAPAAAPAATTETVNPGSWLAGFNDDLKGYIGNKGFKDPAALADAYRGLEKNLGVPAERMLKLPEAIYDENGNINPDARSVFERLGAPKDPKEYGIEVPKEGGDAKRLEFFLKNAHELGLTKSQAQKLAAADTEYASGFIAAQKEAAAQAFRDQDNALAKEWGAAKDQNTRIAGDAMRRLGLDAKKVDAISASLGHAETMKLLCNLGKATGEASFVSGKAAAGPMEPATAKSRINELMADKDFGSKLMNGDSEAKAVWARLHEQAYQGTVNI